VSTLHRSQGSSTALLERLVLASFDGRAGLTRLELGELTGLSRNVVTGVIASLIAKGELAETRQPPATGARGRPPSRYHRTALLPPVLMLQLRKDGSTLVSSLRSDGTHSEVRHCASWAQAWSDWSPSVLDVVRQLGAAEPLPPRLTVLSAPFPVAKTGDALRRRHMESANQLNGKRVRPYPPWLENDPCPALERLLGCTALIVNDANLAALGEARFGAGRGLRTVFHVCVADGIGAGFVFDGRIFAGAHGFTGELAHVQVTPDGPLCFCGNRGCLITEGVVRRLCGGLSPQDGEELGMLVGRALAPMVTTLDPDCLVVDARLAQGCKPFILGLRAELDRRCPPDLAGILGVVAGELEDAERYGALAAANAHARSCVSTSSRVRASAIDSLIG
jgi:predicted NBD/HSP70 family sugar kinase